MYRFFGGKGGVGKTTCAAACAIGAARRGGTVLVASTDPAHSLGDALAMALAGEPRAVPGVPGLTAVEIDGAAAWERWLGPRRAVLAAIAERGTFLRAQDLLPLLELRVPGVDELVGLIEVVRLGARERADLVVVDTAPTGHTLRLLDVPRSLDALASLLDALEERHRALADAFGGGAAPGVADAAIEDVRRDAREVGELLADPERAAVSWVLLPERLAIEESVEAAEALARRGIAVSEIVVNRVAREGDPCSAATGRRDAERAALFEIARRLPGLPTRVVPEASAEPRGPDALAAIAQDIAGPASVQGRDSTPIAADHAFVQDRDLTPVATPPGVVLVAVVGKGGVGKTTCAAGIALELAARDPARRVELVSTDPAHSLRHLLGVERTPTGPVRLPGAGDDVWVEELDAIARFASRRARLAGHAERLLAVDAEGGGVDLPVERAIARCLVEATPPGLDELMAIDELGERLEGDPATTIVLDTAPTGHALRLLEMPDVALGWVHALMRILVDYREALGLGELASDLLGFARSIERVKALLSDPRRATFVAVTRPAALPWLETRRLLDALDRLRAPAGTIVVNAATPRGLPACRAAADAERPWIEHASREAAARGCGILVAPLSYPAPSGAAALLAWRSRWSALAAEGDEGASA
jgi:arsenite-transporting ATPase